MALPKFTGPTVKDLNGVLASAVVRKALEDRAERILPRTKAIALSEGATETAKSLKIDYGVRPGTKAEGGLKRPYVEVSSELTPAQRKAEGYKDRLKILRRGALG